MDDQFNPQPKPEPRPKKQPKPLRRTPLNRNPRSSTQKKSLNERPRPKNRQRIKEHATQAKADKLFQLLGETHHCEVGHYAEQTCYHHVKGRRYTETRHDIRNCVRLCFQHHTEWHSLGPSRFFTLYPQMQEVWTDRGYTKRV